MKYEPVFGDQSLFDGGPEDAEIAAKFEGGIAFFPKQKPSSKVFFVSGVELAMRRIIKEPKRWTVEDQKAGRLPDVGGLVMMVDIDTKNNIFEFVGVCAGSKRFAVKAIDDGLLYFYSKEMIVPIETPEEKAQREEDEFVSIVEFEYNKMPNEISFRAGIRAAYRKLKGGE